MKLLVRDYFDFALPAFIVARGNTCDGIKLGATMSSMVTMSAGPYWSYDRETRAFC
jgi:hypothetical protein